MLETIGLTKIYKPKKGVPVTALDGVSLKFPDKGMVFLLGKSGSGKSTLLNLLGGLDKYDGGEIIIKGVSSRDFDQQHFDSYRNTYVGFIFQEYNILEEFTVGANIALALELQGKKATDGELNRILADVDLEGYGSRRPNELSGGQKQRVAIARALVKNPKIIMADEPSGALDSVTGKQVFDTLKKLSKEKLVIVVSHDREFAVEYADRIIELADGKVISDTTLTDADAESRPEGISFEGTTAKIPMSYRLTEEDRIAINDYLARMQSGGELEFTPDEAAKTFLPTDQTKIINSDNSPFKLIKSKLSLKHAFKIGSGGLKYKKFRLVMTVLLSCVAFVLFGLVDTFSAYNHIKTTANSIYDTGVKYAAVSKSVKYGEGIDSYWDGYGNKMTAGEIAELEAQTGVALKGVLTDNAMGYYFSSNIGNLFSDSENVIFDLTARNFSGIVEINEKDIEDKDYKLLAGRLPDGSKDELLMSKYVCDTFIKFGYIDISDYDENSNVVAINGYSDMLGKTLLIEGFEYEVVGVVDTNLNMDRYTPILETDENDDAASQIIDYVLYSEFRASVENDYAGMMMVGEGFLERFMKKTANAVNAAGVNYYYSDQNYNYIYPYYVTTLGRVDKSEITWLDGERTVLGEKEIIVSDYDLEYNLGAGILDENGGFSIDTEAVLGMDLSLTFWDYNEADIEEDGYKIVGVLNTYNNSKYPNLANCVIVSDSNFKAFFGEGDAIYDLALGTMPDNRSDIETLAEYCYTERDGERYSLNNPASFELDALDEMIDILADIFLWVGLGFALFASILLSNFIATSIAYKKQEIGILRAIGSRGNDVFRIFFAEAFIIAMINFVLACVGTGAITAFINFLLREEIGLLVTVLNFGIRQILLIFAVSIAAAAIASFIPVKRIASKKPIDAIRNR